MNVMKNFTLRSLKRNKKRTVVTIIGVIISVAMITAVTTLASSFVSYIQNGAIADGGNWHAKIQNVSAENLDGITNSGVIDTAVLSRDKGYAQIPDSDSYSKSYLFLREYSANGFDQMSIRLKSGRLPQKSGEVLISGSLLEGSKLSYAIGDTLTLKVGDIITPEGTPLEGNAFLPDTYDSAGNVIASPTFKPRETVTLTVVGIMEAPGFEASYSAGYGVLGYLDKSALSSADSVDVYVTAANISRSLFDDIPKVVKNAGAKEAKVEFNNELLRYYGVISYDNVYQFLQGFVLFMILIIVIASVSLIYNAFAMSVSERSRQLGLLASVGATKQQKRSSVYFEGLFVGLIGIPLGILAGIGGIAITLAAIQPLLTSFINMPESVKMVLVVPPSAIAVTVLFSVITIFISVYKPARRASKITPIDAIRQTQEVRLTGKSVKTSRLTRKLFGFEAEIALKNLKRSRKKYRATVVSLVISLVLFLTVSSYTNIMQGVAGATQDGVNYDISVNYFGLNERQREETNQSIASLELVDGFTSSSELVGTVSLSKDQLSDNTIGFMENNAGLTVGEQNDFNAVVLGLDDNSFTEYAKTAGVSEKELLDTQSPKAILINFGQAYAHTEGNNAKKVNGDILSVCAGDTLSFAAGDPTQKSGAGTVLTIAGTTKERPKGVLIEGFSRAIFVVSKDVWNSIVSGFTGAQLTQLSKQGALRYAAYLSSGDDQRLEVKLNELTQNMPPSSCSIYNFRDLARNENNLSTFLGVFVYGFIILISLICIANIFNTLSTNIGLRRREFAMLRSVGMTPKGFNRMMRFESIFYGLKGLLYGLPISLALALLLYSMQLNVLGSEFSIPWVSYGFAVLMILVIVFSTMLYATHRIKKENIIDALKEENF